MPKTCDNSTFSIISSIVEHILGLVSSINWVREVKNVSSTFKRTTCMFLKIPIWIDRSILWPKT